MRNCTKCGSEFNDEKRSTLCPECRSAVGRRSKRKGAANELRFVKKLQSYFDELGLPYRVRRTPRSGGIHEFEPADVIFGSLPQESVFNKIHFENKDSANWSIVEWYKDAIRKDLEVNRSRNPVLVIRKPNLEHEFAVMDIDFFLKILLSLESLTINERQ